MRTMGYQVLNTIYAMNPIIFVKSLHNKLYKRLL